MTQLNAKTKTIQEIFQQEYVIPEYQRRYSWEKEQCEQLVVDLQESHEAVGDDGQYFLGCIVVAKTDKGTWEVIDGQQRLITISLLIRVLLDKAGTYQDLRKCLQKTDPKTGNFIEELHLTSEVVDEDNNNLKDILLGVKSNTDNRFSKNYEYIREVVESINLGGELEKFIETLLRNVVLLPIECEDVEVALTIFQTLNDRGMQLVDADIFKATMYGKSPERKKFIEDWKKLQEHAKDHYSIDHYFRIYMHILRAQRRVTTKEIKLRSYFKSNPESLDNTDAVMQCLHKCQSTHEWESSATTTIWWKILENYPNYYWQFPLYVFLNKYGEYKGQEFSMSKQNEGEFIDLLKETTRYCYIKGVVNNSVNSIKDTIFKICMNINDGGNYKMTYQNNADGDMNEFVEKLKRSDCGRYQRGLVVISSALHPSQKDEENRTAFAGNAVG